MASPELNPSSTHNAPTETLPIVPVQDTIAPPATPEVSLPRIRGPFARGVGRVVLTVGRVYERNLHERKTDFDKQNTKAYEKLEKKGRAEVAPVPHNQRTRKEDRKLRQTNVRDLHAGRRHEIITRKHNTYDIPESDESLKARESQLLIDEAERLGIRVSFDSSHDKLLRQALTSSTEALADVEKKLAVPAEQLTSSERRQLEAERSRLKAKNRSLDYQLRDKVAHLTRGVTPVGSSEYAAALPGSTINKYKKGKRKAHRAIKWHGFISGKQKKKSEDFKTIMKMGGLEAAKADEKFETRDKAQKRVIARTKTVTANLTALEAALKASKANDPARINARHERFKQTPVTREIIQLNEAALVFEAKLRSKAGRTEIGHTVLHTIMGTESDYDLRSRRKKSKKQPIK